MASLSVEVISLEKVIRKFKKQNNEIFYFSTGGHLNKKAHKTLGNWMAKTFYK